MRDISLLFFPFSYHEPSLYALFDVSIHNKDTLWVLVLNRTELPVLSRNDCIRYYDDEYDH